MTTYLRYPATSMGLPENGGSTADTSAPSGFVTNDLHQGRDVPFVPQHARKPSLIVVVRTEQEIGAEPVHTDQPQIQSRIEQSEQRTLVG